VVRDYSFDRVIGPKKHILDRSAPAGLGNQNSGREPSKKLKGRSSKSPGLGSATNLKLGKLAGLIVGRSTSSIRGSRPHSPTAAPINYYSINNYNIYPRSPSDRLIARSSAKSGHEIPGQQNLREELRKVFLTKHDKGLLVRSGSRDYQERIHMPEMRSSKPRPKPMLPTGVTSEVLIYPQISSLLRDPSPGAEPLTSRKSGFFLKKSKQNPSNKAGTEYEKQNSATFSHKSYSTIKRASKSQKRQMPWRGAETQDNSGMGEQDTSVQQMQSGSRLVNDSVDDYAPDSGQSKHRGSWRVENTSRSNSKSIGPTNFVELPKRSYTIGHTGDEHSVFDQLANSLEGFQQDLLKTRRTWNRGSIQNSVETVRQSKPLNLIAPTPSPSPLSLATSRANLLLASLISLLTNSPTPSLKAYLEHPDPVSFGSSAAPLPTYPAVTFSNLNFHNLIREFTRHMMLKTNRLLPQYHGTEERLLLGMQGFLTGKLHDGSTVQGGARDLIREGLFSQVAHLYQQQQVIEDVVLQLKAAGMDVDSVFQRAYVLLGIVAKEDPPESQEGIEEQAPYDEVSVEGGLREDDTSPPQTPIDKKTDKSGTISSQLAPQGGWLFPLDFNRLEYSISQPNSEDEPD
jgi:hypothetical protein